MSKDSKGDNQLYIQRIHRDNDDGSDIQTSKENDQRKQHNFINYHVFDGQNFIDITLCLDSLGFTYTYHTRSLLYYSPVVSATSTN